MSQETVDSQAIHEETLIAHSMRQTARGATVTATVRVVVEIDGRVYEAEREVKMALRPTKVDGRVLLTAASAVADVVHARLADARVSLCGRENVHPTDTPWDPDSVYSCHRCKRLTAP